MGINLFYTRLYDEALEQLEQTLELNPEFYSTQWGLGWAYFVKGMYQEAIESFGPKSVFSTFAYNAMGRKEEALKLAEDTEKLYSEGESSPEELIYIATGYLGVGILDQAFEYIEKAYRDHSPFLLDFDRHPVYHDLMKSDPRYEELLKKMGLAGLLK